MIWQDILLTFIISLSFPLGILLYYLTKEEYTLGKKYYLWLSRLTLVGLVLFFIILFYRPLLYTELIISLLLIVLGFYVTIKFPELKLISLSLFLSLNHLLIYSLIIIYSLAFGTLKAPTYSFYGIKESLVWVVVLILVSTVVLFTSSYLVSYLLYYALGSIGALIKEKI